MKMLWQWVPSERNSSYNFILIFLNFVHVFAMVWSYAYGLDIILELIFVHFFHFVNFVIFRPQILWKCIDSSYLVSATPYTISCPSLCNFAHLFFHGLKMCMWFEFNPAVNFCHFSTLLTLSVFAGATSTSPKFDLFIVEAIVRNNPAKFQLYPQNIWGVFFLKNHKFCLLVAMVTNQIKRFQQKKDMFCRGPLNISIKLLSKYLQWDSSKCHFSFFPIISSNASMNLENLHTLALVGPVIDCRPLILFCVKILVTVKVVEISCYWLGAYNTR